MNVVNWIVAVGVAMGFTGFAHGEEQHPRIFITPARLTVIRQQAAVKDSHHQLALAQLKALLDKPDTEAAGDKYGDGYKAVENAFLSAVAEDPVEKKKYADAAFQWIAGWTKTGSATLGKSMEGRCLALAYDWAWPAWSAEQRATMRQRVDAVLAALGGVTHSNLGGDRSSNFVGVIRGAELLLQLASGAAVKSDRCQFLVGELKRYFDSFGDVGASQEGPGYTEYPGPFAFGAALAAQECGDATLTDAIGKHAFWKMLMYTRSTSPQANQSLQWGVGGGADYTEGWSSQMLALCPADQLPAYLWWYDRTVGRLTTATMAHRFDEDRHGAVWALLYYPVGVTAKDPTGTFPTAVADKRGYIWFRNHWQATGSILTELIAQTKKDEKGWNQPEQLAINLLAFGQHFIAGPAKNTKPESYSALLVDGKYTYKDATTRLGKVVAFEPGKDGGYAIVQGGEMYEKLGVNEAVRHLLVNYHSGNEAIVATLDRVKTGAGAHTYTWQANTSVGLAASTEAGRPCFLLKGAENAFVKGWVLHPADAEVSPAKPLRVTTKGGDADIWVVMFVGTGTPPTGQISGNGLASVLTVAGSTVQFAAEKERIQIMQTVKR